MSRTKQIALWIVWLIAGAYVYAYLWSTHLDFFPQFPEQIGRWIAQLTGTDATEDTEQLTLYYVLILSFAVVAAVTGTIASLAWAFQRFKRKRV